MAAPDYSQQGYKDIIPTLDGAVLTVLMNRTKQRNTFTKRICHELVNVFGLSDKDDRVVVVILTADPTAAAYCSGADLGNGWDALWNLEAEREGEHAHRDGGGILSMAIYRSRKITIAAINGHAAGIGMTALQLPFDLRFVWSGAKLTFPFIRVGIVPEAASTYLLPKLLGTSRANSLFLTGSVVSPESSHIKDLYHQILPTREAVYPAAKALADELAVNASRLSVAYTKGLVHHPGNSIEENHILDSRAIKLLGSSPDGAEGVKAFKEKRHPKFPGILSKDLSPWYPWWPRIDIRHHKSKL